MLKMILKDFSFFWKTKFLSVTIAHKHGWTFKISGWKVWDGLTSNMNFVEYTKLPWGSPKGPSGNRTAIFQPR